VFLVIDLVRNRPRVEGTGVAPRRPLDQHWLLYAQDGPAAHSGCTLVGVHAC
jgi:hypothetical protein